MHQLAAFRLAWPRVAPGVYRHATGAIVRRSGRADALRWTIAAGARAGDLFGSLASATAVAAPLPAAWPRDVRRERTLHPLPAPGMLF